MTLFSLRLCDLSREWNPFAQLFHSLRYFNFFSTYTFHAFQTPHINGSYQLRKHIDKLKVDLPESEPEPKKKHRSSTTSFYPTKAQNRLLDVCGYKNFVNPPAFNTIKEANAFITKYADNKKAFKVRYGSEPCPGEYSIFSINF